MVGICPGRGAERVQPSFSAAVRDELARVPAAGLEERIAELAGLILTVGRWLPRGRAAGLVLRTPSAALARRITGWLKDDFRLEVAVAARGSPQAVGGRRYEVRGGPVPAARRVLAALDLLDAGGELRPDLPAAVRRGPAGAACLRGLFAGAGHIHPPQLGYHLEIRLRSAALASGCAGLMTAQGLRPGVSARRGGHAVYLKEGDQVVRFLTVTGAHAAVLAYEDARIYREVRGQVNRLVNAETANLEKAIGAAAAQVRDIEFLDRQVGLENLAPALREAARLRLAHRDLSLRDLGREFNPPLSKSAVAHRMRRLRELAGQLRRDAGRDAGRIGAGDEGRDAGRVGVGDEGRDART